MALAVSVTWKRLFLLLFRLDSRLLSGLGLRAILLVEARFVGHLQVHKVGLLEAEEDEWLMAHICQSQLLSFFFPLAGDLLFPLVYFDSDTIDDEGLSRPGALPVAVREGIMTFYRDCVRRHLYARASLWRACKSADPAPSPTPTPSSASTNTLTAPIFLSKNPAFTMRLRTLKRLFPSCRAAVLLRDPLQSVPSLVSYIAMAWAAFASPTPTNRYPNTTALVDFCLQHYRFPLCELRGEPGQSGGRGWPSQHYVWVPYARLKTHLRDSVVGLLKGLGYWGMATSRGQAVETKVMQRLADEQLRAWDFVSAHEHGVVECCRMRPEELRALLSGVYAAVGDLLE